MEDVERLEGLLPPLIKSDLNERTCWVFRAFWVDHKPTREIASEREWSVPAVEFHLKRAEKALKDFPQ